MMNFKIKILLSILPFLVFSYAIAEPYNIDPNLSKKLISDIRTGSWSFSEKFEQIQTIKQKLSNIENSTKKNEFIQNITKFEKIFILENLRKYSVYKYFGSKSKKIDLNYFRNWYQVISRIDIKADIHPYYLINLEKNIKQEKNLNEQSNIFRAYIFLIANLREKNEFIKVEDSLWKIDEIVKNADFKNKASSYEQYFNKIMVQEKINKYSINDFYKIKEKILNEKISPNSRYYNWFLYWYSKYFSILKNWSLKLSSNILHDLQIKPLSCESNSATDFINYFYAKKWIPSISEQEIIDALPKFEFAISQSSNNLFWWDPNFWFVWSIDWKQSRNPNKITWYWVYADPISKIISDKLSNQNLKVKKNIFNEKNILEALWNWSPIIFWYLLPVDTWSRISYNFDPIIWKTPEWKTINWYIWQHTWIISWVDINKNWKIENLYFYEWKEKNLQVRKFSEISKTAKLFDEILYINTEIR